MLLFASVNVFLANGAGLVIGSLTSFALNRKHTPGFAKRILLKPFIIYIGLGAGSYLISSALFLALESAGELNPITLNLSKLTTIGVLFIAKFLLSRQFVFERKIR